MRVFWPGMNRSRENQWRTGLSTSMVFPAKGTSENSSPCILGQTQKSKAGQTNFFKLGFINPAGAKEQYPIYTAKPCSISPDFIYSQNNINLFPIRHLRTFFGPDADELYCGILS